MTSGYSGAPLAKKLSLKDGMRLWRDGMPQGVADEIAAEDLQLRLLDQPEGPLDAAHIFVIGRADLDAKLHQLMPMLAPSGYLDQLAEAGSKVPTDITEDVIRDVCLPMGLVDVKVCAIDATWSGLKLMMRKTAR